MHRYGATEEDFCRVAVKIHYYGSLNPKAQFQRAITLEECLSSRYVAWPLKLYDSSPVTDGAAAVMLAGEEAAREITDTPVWIKAIGYANGTANLCKRLDFLGLEAARLAARLAYKKSGIDPENPAKHLDVAEIHDCFTIAEIMAKTSVSRRGVRGTS